MLFRSGTFSEKISALTDIKIKTIDMVTTAMVLEAARKTALIDSDLASVYAELREFNGYSRKVEEVPVDELKPRAILALCSTGKGTAEKIKQMIDEILTEHLIDDVCVLPLSVVGIKAQLKQIEEKYQLIATTGVADPKLGVPYISLEELFQGEVGKKLLVECLEQTETEHFETQTTKELAPDVTQEMAANYLEQYYTFINPKKIIHILWEYCTILEQEKKEKITDTKRLAVVMHLGGMIERSLRNAPVSLTKKQALEMKEAPWAQAVKKADTYLETTLDLKLARAEEYYIIKLLETEAVKS